MAKNDLTTEQYLSAARHLFDLHEELTMRVNAFAKVTRNEISNMVDTDTDGLSFLVDGLERIAADLKTDADQIAKNNGLYIGDAA